MCLESSTKFTLSIFFAIGLSPFRFNSNHDDSRSSIWSKVPQFAQATASFAIAMTMLYMTNTRRPSNEITTAENFTVNLYFIGEFARAGFVLMQCVLYADLLIEIMAIFKGLEIYFVKNLQHRIFYGKFMRQYRHRISIIFGFFMVYITSFSMRIILQDHITFIGMALKLLQLMTAMTYSYIIFYVELLSFYLSELNVVIKNDTFKYSNNVAMCCDAKYRAQIKDRLKSYKIVHFRLWLISQRMNRYFGYSIIAIILHAFTDSVYSALWTFQQYRKFGGLAIWSEFIIDIRHALSLNENICFQ